MLLPLFDLATLKWGAELLLLNTLAQAVFPGIGLCLDLRGPGSRISRHPRWSTTQPPGQSGQPAPASRLTRSIER